jgi:hypothetical protein
LIVRINASDERCQRGSPAKSLDISTERSRTNKSVLGAVSPADNAPVGPSQTGCIALDPPAPALPDAPAAPPEVGGGGVMPAGAPVGIEAAPADPLGVAGVPEFDEGIMPAGGGVVVAGIVGVVGVADGG